MAKSFQKCGETGGVSHSMLMPYTVIDITDVRLKDNTVAHAANTVDFYNSLETDFSDLLMETATLQQVANQLEQTVVDTGGGISGILTQILTCTISSGGDIIVRITLDGVLTTFQVTLPINLSSVLCIGDFVNSIASESYALSYGGRGSAGYAGRFDQTATMLTPLDSLSKGLPFGMVFEDSMKVTVQGVTNLAAGSTSEKCAVAWLTTIPLGVL